MLEEYRKGVDILSYLDRVEIVDLFPCEIEVCEYTITILHLIIFILFKCAKYIQKKKETYIEGSHKNDSSGNFYCTMLKSPNLW